MSLSANHVVECGVAGQVSICFPIMSRVSLILNWLESVSFPGVRHGILKGRNLIVARFYDHCSGVNEDAC